MASEKPVLAARAATAPPAAAPSFTKLLATLVTEETALFLNCTTLRVALTISLETPLVFLAALMSPPDMLSRRFRIVLITLFAMRPASFREQSRDGRLDHGHLLVIVQSPRPRKEAALHRGGRRQNVQRDAPGGVKGA